MNTGLRYKAAFTLVELLVVIAIIGVFSGLLFPTMVSIRESARAFSCRSNLQQLSLAQRSYEQTYRSLPMGTMATVLPVRSVPVGLHHNWISHSLPFLGSAKSVQVIDFTASVYDSRTLG